MPRNSSGGGKSGLGAIRWKDPRFLVRAILGILVAGNLIAAGFVMFPPGGSSEQLDQEMATLQSQVTRDRATLEQTRRHVKAVEQGRAEGDKFLSQYFLPRRGAYSTLVNELNQAAMTSKIKPREHAFAIQPIEGSTALSMMTITANFEGAYKDVLSFVHEVDTSPRLLIIESLNAAPQQGSNLLTVSMKLDTFVREDASAEEGAGE